MEIFSIETGNFKMDGGAMFGVIPKSLWSRSYPCDENNYANFAMRSLLIIDEDRKILIDTGMGHKTPEKVLKHYYLNGDAELIKSLAKIQVKPEDITHVILTHLHFDHCGGSVTKNGDELFPTFSNAQYYVSRMQYEYALNPGVRDGASYFLENYQPLMDAGVLTLVDDEGELMPNIDIRFTWGHTEAQMIPVINYVGHKIVFGADLLPTAAHFPAAWVMAYDNLPLVTIEENETLLKEAADNDYLIFLEHDITTEAATVVETPKGFRIGEKLGLQEWINRKKACSC